MIFVSFFFFFNSEIALFLFFFFILLLLCVMRRVLTISVYKTLESTFLLFFLSTLYSTPLLYKEVLHNNETGSSYTYMCFFFFVYCLCCCPRSMLHFRFLFFFIFCCMCECFERFLFFSFWVFTIPIVSSYKTFHASAAASAVEFKKASLACFFFLLLFVYLFFPKAQLFPIFRLSVSDFDIDI